MEGNLDQDESGCLMGRIYEINFQSVEVSRHRQHSISSILDMDL